LELKLSKFLSAKKKDRGVTSFNTIKSALLSFGTSSDCLDYFGMLRGEGRDKEMCTGGIMFRAMRDVLRSFSFLSFKNLGDELVDTICFYN
jgi:hypothetical protein